MHFVLFQWTLVVIDVHQAIHDECCLSIIFMLTYEVGRKARPRCCSRAGSVLHLLSVFSCLNLVRTLSLSASPPSRTESAGIYLHIPFCRRRCYYCDFPIMVVGDRPESQRIAAEKYTDILLKDIEVWSRQKGQFGRDVDTIYFGGGTPSLLTDDCLDRIIRQLKQNFHVHPQSEITLEMDPGTFTYDRLLSLRNCGINRISMGVQSFDNTMLRHCGRPHTVEDTERALNDLHRAGWENFSIDLISSLPHLNPQLWAETLHRAAQCGSAHISVYDLQVEPGTAFARWYAPGVSPLPAEGDAADMYRTAASALTAAGFEHYEVSNYAKPGRRSRHNLKYWTCAPVLGFGMAAASYLRGERFVRPKKMQEYEKYVLDLLAADAAAGEHSAERGLNRQSQQQQQRHHAHIPDMLDVVMLALRTADGLDLASFTELYGAAATARVLGTLEPYRQRGLVRGGTAAVISSDGKHGGCSGDGSIGSGGSGDSRVRLSDPEGFLLSNDIISSVFAALPDSSSQ